MKINFPVSFTLVRKTATINESFTLAGITVPAGYKSDGISSPRFIWFKFHPFSQYVAAAFVHDYCIDEIGHDFARNKFYQALKELGASSFEKFLLYNAVRFKDWQRRLFKKIGIGVKIESSNKSGASRD